MSDPVIDCLGEHINAIAEMCNANIKPWVPNSARRAQNLLRELAKPYIDTLCDYMASRPKSPFPVAWCNRVEGLVADIDNYL